MIRGELDRVLAALEAAEVRYLVVGGLAVVLHGHLRTTVDLDLVIQLEPENLRRALDALEKLGYQPVVPVPIQAFADPTNRQTWIEEKNMVVFSLWRPDRPTFKLDVFVAEPFDFEVTYDRALEMDLGGTRVNVIALDDLVAMKREAARPQDLADVEALERIRKRHEK